MRELLGNHQWIVNLINLISSFRNEPALHYERAIDIISLISTSVPMRKIDKRKQQEIKELLREGLTQEEIAARLNVGVATVGRYGKGINLNETDLERLDREIGEVKRRMNCAEDNIEELFTYVFEKDELGSNNRLADKLLIIGKE